MSGKWSRLGAFVVAAVLIVSVVVLSTDGLADGWVQILLQVSAIAFAVYATTFVVWPRRLFGTPVVVHPIDQAARVVEPAPAAKPARRPVPEFDERPVAIIQSRPAGSEPGSRVHIPENPTIRTSRGRRVGGHEASRDFRWPAQR